MEWPDAVAPLAHQWFAPMYFQFPSFWHIMVVPSPGIFVPGSYGVPEYQHIKVSFGCACAIEAGRDQGRESADRDGCGGDERGEA
jgi:hypothetical protein